MTTGEKIKSLRLAKGMTQGELAEKLGVKVPAIYKYEQGIVINLKRSTIEKLALALEVDPSYLIGFESDSVSDDRDEWEEAWEKATPEKRQAALAVLKL